jgi:glycosyltransferase involved in cell wall biosynthesis
LTASEVVEKPLVSLVVPVLDEEDCIDEFARRARAAAARADVRYEIVFVDDGSSDETWQRLMAARERDPAVKVVGLSRNFGKDIALTAGLDHSCGEAVVAIDVDLQDPPEVIPELVAKWREGHDVVYARRLSRAGDSAAKRVSAAWFYRVHHALSEIDIPADTGDFRLMDRKVIEALGRVGERNRFMKGLFTWVGFRQAEVGYRRAARAAGE